MHLSHEVLIVHHANFEVIAVSELIELAFEIVVELVHASTKPIQKVFICLLLELKVISNVFVDLYVILQFRYYESLDERVLACVLQSFKFEILRLHVLKIIIIY